RPSLVNKAGKKVDLGLAHLPWRSGLSFLLFLFAQVAWTPPGSQFVIAVPAALLAIGMAVWALVADEWRMPQVETGELEKKALTFRRTPLVISLLFFGSAFLLSGGNQFNLINTLLWISSTLLLLVAFWQVDGDAKARWRKFLSTLRQREWKIQISRWSLLLLAAFAVVAFFRFHQLNAIPPEMTSDHAEKLLDVFDIQNGQFSIFFTRNAGREPLQFYLTDFVAGLFGTGISFLSLKLGTTFLAFISLIYMYLLGKELGGRRVGLFALLLTGLAFWANLLARIGLRFSLYPTFAAPVLYYLIRGLRCGSLNDLLLCGLFLGIGLNGYTSFRIMPFVVAIAVIVYLLHRATAEQRRRALIGFALLALVSLVVFTPLLRYMIDNFALFGERMLTRVGEAERPYPAPVLVIFATNVARALGMFNYNGGNIWTVGLVGQPAFDFFSATLLMLGVCVVIFRYIRQRNWQDILLLVAIPIMMLPSSLSLAFPEENPAMNRASGAWIPAFLICAIGLDALLHGVRERLGGKTGLRVAQSAGVLMFVGIAGLNYSLFFSDYSKQYDAYAWNTSELGNVIADYADTFGTLDSAWVVSYPYWVDTRLVAMNAGYPQHDYGIWPDQLSNTLGVPAPKLFLLKPEDTEGLSVLQQLYPDGVLQLRESRLSGKEFMVYFVPVLNNGN
ncbi:MAG TPA: glycosyltransferase family 39 protein, partial [Terriglobales bacterium]|nr:glycosyltransferase family 39 protein [Terriglobales bacterium]